MRIFVTGATGFVGTPVVADLIAAGHSVLGLTRSPDGAAALRAAGAEVHHGAIKDLDSLKVGAAQADAVIHLAFNHDFSTFAQNCADDRDAINAMGEVLAGPMIVTSGTAIALSADGRPAHEDSPVLTSADHPRALTEETAAALSAAGKDVRLMRLSQIHDATRAGLITFAAQLAKQTGVSAYVGEGQSAWSAAHISDVAPLYRLALERGAAGARYHAVGEEGVHMKAIAETLAARLGVPARSLTPEDAAAHFGWLAMFTDRDMRASSAKTRAALGWTPNGPALLDDLARFEVP